ncbi:MAG: response regulator [Desulfatitalea sp.]|nr:response regulator [Desulfatitalea sp.]
MEILIVEDDFISRNLLKKMLVEMGHQVVETENGRQAWELLLKRPIYLVIADWMMPEMDGLELCRNIRRVAFDGYIYIVVLTSKDRRKDLMEVFQAGADDYIPKPFDPEELKARVSTGLRVVDLESRHKKMQNILLESRNKLRTVIDALQEEIIALDRDYTIVSVNKAFAQRLGVKAEEMIGQRCFDDGEGCTAHAFLLDLRPLVEAVFEKGSAQHLLYTYRDERGAISYKQIEGLPITQQDRAGVAQALIVSKDITEDRRKASEIHALNERVTVIAAEVESGNASLKSALKRLETTQAQMVQSEKMAIIGQLAAGVAHEINNPTSFVSSNLKTLSGYHDNLSALLAKHRELSRSLQAPEATQGMRDEIRAKVQAIQAFETEIDVDFLLNDSQDVIRDCREGTERIKKIVLDLKDFAHPGEEALQSTDINKGLESTLNVVHNELKFKATVTTELGVIPTVKGYPQQLNQVFINILVNAAQAIDTRGEIHIKTRKAEDGFVEVIISDTGCGISEEHRSRIFDPFFTTKELGKGTGLGLNIAYNIVKKHNGAIAVKSEADKGTTFTIRLPAEG